MSVPFWRPDRYARRRPNLEARLRILRATRRWFEERDFVEVDTPALQVCPGMEPHLATFAADFISPDRSSRRTYHLHTSPEFAMKKLLVAGERRIFQLTHVFRNAEWAPTHHPEFSMLEWYRVGEGYTSLIDDCVGLVRGALTAIGSDRVEWSGRTCDPFGDWRVLTVVDAFAEYAGIDLLATYDGTMEPDPAPLVAAATAAGMTAHEGDRWEDVFFRVMFKRIEPFLGDDRPCVLTDYPLNMAALSRPKPSDPRLAERFELYICGVELANAFGELTDAAQQRARFEADAELKERLHGERVPIDEDFLAALEWGMPESSGIALGFDRLVMLAAGAATVDDVLWAPVAP